MPKLDSRDSIHELDSLEVSCRGKEQLGSLRKAVEDAFAQLVFAVVAAPVINLSRPASFPPSSLPNPSVPEQPEPRLELSMARSLKTVWCS